MEPIQVSMRTKTTIITNKKLGRRRPKQMQYEEPIRKEPIRRDGSVLKKTTTKKNWAE